MQAKGGGGWHTRRANESLGLGWGDTTIERSEIVVRGIGWMSRMQGQGGLLGNKSENLSLL